MTLRRAARYVAAAMPDVALVTVPNVEILEVGENWATSTGVFTWDHEDLVSAIMSQDDPAVRTPVTKLGHVDPRFDGQPSWGRLQNLRLTENEQTLIADLVGVPAWLAAVMASAYPRRSIEGWFDVHTRTGNEWSFVLTGLALLGDAYPAINTLEDLEVLWGEVAPPLEPAGDVPEVVASYGGLVRATRIEEDQMPKWLLGHGDEVAAADDAPTNPRKSGGAVRAAVSVTDIVRAYYDSLDSGQYWWWIREVRVNPAELIVDDDDGGLFRVTYAIEGDDTVIFGEPVPVEVVYVDVAASDGSGVMVQIPKTPKMERGQIVAASWQNPDDAHRPERVAASDSPTEPSASGTVPETPTQEDTSMDDATRAALRKKYGLADDADDAAILAAVAAEASDPADGGNGTGDEPPAGTPDDGNDDSQPQTPATAPEGQPATAPEDTTGGGTPAVQVPEGMVLVDAAAWEKVTKVIDTVESDQVAAAARRKEEVLAGAIKAGKFGKAQKEAQAASYDLLGHDAYVAMIEKAAAVVPVAERGVAAAGGDDESGPSQAYPSSWAPSVRTAQRAAAGRVKIAGDA